MAANTSPIFSLTPQLSWVKISAADGSSDGTDADVGLACTAGANGSFVNRIIFQPRSTSGSTTTSAAAARIYINNGSTVATGTNNVLLREMTLPALAVDLTKTTEAAGFEVPVNIQLKAAYRIYIGITAIAANTNWDVTVIFGDY